MNILISIWKAAWIVALGIGPTLYFAVVLDYGWRIHIVPVGAPVLTYGLWVAVMVAHYVWRFRVLSDEEIEERASAEKLGTVIHMYLTPAILQLTLWLVTKF